MPRYTHHPLPTPPAESSSLTKQQIISELTKSPHGDLKQYAKTGLRAAIGEPEFFAHLLSWNRVHGHVRDSQVALPVLALALPKPTGGILLGDPTHPDTYTAKMKAWSLYEENALAHLASLSPRDLCRAWSFYRDLGLLGTHTKLRRVIQAYLKVRETHFPWLERSLLQHKASMARLYALTHTAPSPYARAVLDWKRKDGTIPALPPKSIFHVLRGLKLVSPQEAASAIQQHHIPLLPALGYLGKKAKDPDVLFALINTMSSAELVSSMTILERYGVKDHPHLRGALEARLQKTAGETGAGMLKTSRAAGAVKDVRLKAKLEAVQESQVQKAKDSGSIEGNWLILADKSGSMRESIKTGRMVAAYLTSMVKGEVHLVFFDAEPRHFDVTGKSLADINKLTGMVVGNGYTCIGCGVDYARMKGFQVDGIAVISDGGENRTPDFTSAYHRLALSQGTQPAVYYFHTDSSEMDVLSKNMREKGQEIDFQMFELGTTVDYYSLPNLVKTMRASRYGLLDEIMETPLLTMAEALKFKSTAREGKGR